MPSLSLRMYAPSIRFSRTVSRGKILRPSGTWQMPMRTISSGAVRWIGWPRNSMVPSLHRSSPEMVIRVVDLPAPFAPMRHPICPSWSSNETPLRAWMLP